MVVCERNGDTAAEGVANHQSGLINTHPKQELARPVAIAGEVGRVPGKCRCATESRQSWGKHMDPSGYRT